MSIASPTRPATGAPPQRSTPDDPRSPTEAYAQVAPRLRVLLWLDLSLTIVLLLLDARAPTSHALRAVFVTQIGWSLGWILLSRVPRAPRRIRQAAVLAVFGVHALQLLAGWQTDEVAASAILSSGSALIVAFIVPWGASTQAVSATLTGTLISLQAAAAGSFTLDSLPPAPVALPLGVLVASVFVAADADRKRRAAEAMHEELRRASEDLELRVESRTAELVAARDLAERETRGRRDLIAHTSHDLRTPINVIWGYKDMLLDSKLTSEQRQFVERIGRAADQLRRLSNDLLDLSRADAGDIEIRTRDFSLQRVLTQSVEPFEAEARSRGLRLSHDTSPDVPDTLVGDPDRLRQILTNLIGNALKFTPAGGIHIGVTRGTESEGVVFEVSDTGIGIAPDEQERIFEAFAQVPGSHYEGSGLGLAICRRLVDRMGGRIELRSSPDEGSTFRIHLPLPRARTALPRATAAAASGGR